MKLLAPCPVVPGETHRSLRPLGVPFAARNAGRPALSGTARIASIHDCAVDREFAGDPVLKLASAAEAGLEVGADGDLLDLAVQSHTAVPGVVLKLGPYRRWSTRGR